MLITGGCGFIGSNFILNQINNTNNKILNFDALTYAGNLENLSSIKDNKNYKFVHGNICNYRFLKDTINDFKPEVIVHFAAESHVDRSIDKPLYFVESNIVGTAYLLDILKNYYFKNYKILKNKFCFVNVSTDEVFGSLDKSGYFTEKTPYNPSSPYSSSKASADMLAKAWYKTFDFPTITTNCSNNYGPFQFPEKLIPLIIANCLDKKHLPIYGDGENIRDWLFVNDHCDAIYKIIRKGKAGETYNIGGNNELSNIEIVTKICKIMDHLRPLDNFKLYSDLIKFVEDRPGHDFRYAINSNKLKKNLNWQPKESFHSGIEKTVIWYLNNEKWWRKIQEKNYNQERLGLNND